MICAYMQHTTTIIMNALIRRHACEIRPGQTEAGTETHLLCPAALCCACACAFMMCLFDYARIID